MAFIDGVFEKGTLSIDSGNLFYSENHQDISTIQRVSSFQNSTGVESSHTSLNIALFFSEVENGYSPFQGGKESFKVENREGADLLVDIFRPPQRYRFS